jgi:hypothetical protein
MVTMNDVLYVPVDVQMQPMLSLVREMHSVVDEESVRVLDTLIDLDILDDSASQIDGIGIMEFQDDIPFIQIPHMIETQGFVPVSPNLCMYFLYLLKGKKNTETRRSFFAKGMVLLSSDPILIKGKLHYLVIGQNQCEKKQNQNPFSIRLLTPPKIFLHSLYKVLVAKSAD